MPTFYLDYENGSDSNDGTSWVNAWKTITGGPTAARIASGDVIRIAKSPAPYSIGEGSWTNLSKTVTLTSASQTANIDMCETAWTANGSGDTTVTRQGTTWKEGTYAMTLTLDSSPQTNTMQAYYTITDTNFSSFQKISFWIRNSAAIVDGNWKVTLCSDTGGTTAVDTFAIPPIPSTARFVPLTLAKIGGGNLGSSIQSIAITTGSAAPTASSNIIVDDFIACTTSGLNLQSLISKNSAEQGGTEPWHGIQSINGTTVLLDNDTNTLASAGRGYYGTTISDITYARETIKLAMSATADLYAETQTMDAGTPTNPIEFQGGYDTGTSLQTGETFWDLLNCYGYGLYFGTSCTRINRLNFCRARRAVNINSIFIFYVDNIFICNSYYGIYSTGAGSCEIDNVIANNCDQHGVYFSRLFNGKIDTIRSFSNGTYGISLNESADNYISNITTGNNATAGLYVSSGLAINILSFISGDTTPITENIVYANPRLYIKNYNSYALIRTAYGNIVSQVATGGGTGLEWKMSVTSSARTLSYALKLTLTEIAVIANNQVAVTCYFKKSHATDIGARLVCPADQLDGVTETYTTCPEDTNRNQLQIQFTPTESGVLRVEAWAYWVANTADEYVLVDDISVSQG